MTDIDMDLLTDFNRILRDVRNNAHELEHTVANIQNRNDTYTAHRIRDMLRN